MSYPTRKRARESADLEDERQTKSTKPEGRDQPRAASPPLPTSGKGQQAQPRTGKGVFRFRSPTAGFIKRTLGVMKKKLKIDKKRVTGKADGTSKEVSPLPQNTRSFLRSLEETLENALDEQIDLRETFQMAVAACTMVDVMQISNPGKRYGYEFLQGALQQFSNANNPFTSIDEELTKFCRPFDDSRKNALNEEKHLKSIQGAVDIATLSLHAAAASGIIVLYFVAPFVALALGPQAISKVHKAISSSLSQKVKAEITRLDNISSALKDLLREGNQMQQDISQTAKEYFGNIQDMGKTLLSKVNEALQKDGHVHVEAINDFRREHRQFTTKLKMLVMHARESFHTMEKTASDVMLEMNAHQPTDTSGNEGSGAGAAQVTGAVSALIDKGVV